MIKLINNNKQDFTAQNVISMYKDFNSNNNISFSNNTITINKCGYYKIDASFTVTATANTTIQLYANNVPIQEAIATLSSESGTATLVISDVEKVVKKYGVDSNVALTFVVSGESTISNVNVSVFEIR